MSGLPVPLNPMRINGAWDDGWTLDLHISSSEFLGYDEYGHPRYETTRTPLGELLYRLKYKQDKSTIEPIALVAGDFIRQWNPGIDVVVPVPPSKARSIQPLFQLAEELGRRLGLPVDSSSIRKIKSMPQLKDVDRSQRTELLEFAHSIKNRAFLRRRVLLVDDLYQSGATLNAVARLLKERGHAAAVLALALTRTRS